MERSLHLALPVALLTTVVVLLRSIIAFEPPRAVFDLRTLSVLSRGLWMVLAVLAFPGLGAWFEGRGGDSAASDMLVVAGIAAFVGSLAGLATVQVGTDAAAVGGPLTAAAMAVGFAVLDGALVGLLVVAGGAVSNP